MQNVNKTLTKTLLHFSEFCSNLSRINNFQQANAPWQMFLAITKGTYMLKVNNKNTGKRCKICSKLTTKTTRATSIVNWSLSSATGGFIVSLKRIFRLALVFLLIMMTLAWKCRLETYYLNENYIYSTWGYLF